MIRLEAHHVSFKIKGKTLVDDVSFALRQGELLAVVGPNGAGKSTLLKLLCGDLRVWGGDVMLWGRPLAAWPVREQAQLRAVLPQNSTLTFPFTALEVVLMGRIPHNNGVNRQADAEIAAAALHRVGMSHLAERLYPTLSGGERQQVQLARVLAQLGEDGGERGRVLLLDEPTTSLDLAHQHHTLCLAREYATMGVAVLAILHDLNLAAQYADRILMLKQGRLREIGTPEQVLTSHTIQDVFATPTVVMPHPQNQRPMVVPVL